MLPPSTLADLGCCFTGAFGATEDLDVEVARRMGKVAQSNADKAREHMAISHSSLTSCWAYTLG
jgi:hypothetical protein